MLGRPYAANAIECPGHLMGNNGGTRECRVYDTLANQFSDQRSNAFVYIRPTPGDDCDSATFLFRSSNSFGCKSQVPSARLGKCCTPLGNPGLVRAHQCGRPARIIRTRSRSSGVSTDTDSPLHAVSTT